MRLAERLGQLDELVLELGLPARRGDARPVLERGYAALYEQVAPPGERDLRGRVTTSRLGDLCSVTGGGARIEEEAFGPGPLMWRPARSGPHEVVQHVDRRGWGAGGSASARAADFGDRGSEPLVAEALGGLL